MRVKRYFEVEFGDGVDYIVNEHQTSTPSCAKRYSRRNCPFVHGVQYYRVYKVVRSNDGNRYKRDLVFDSTKT